MRIVWKTYLNKWIYPHRRGIMGTVIFHLLLAISFLSMEMAKINVHTEMEIAMSMPDPEEIRQQQEEQLRKEEVRQKSSAEEVERMLRSIAVNENVKPQKNMHQDVQKYVEEVMQEIQENEAGGNYRAQKDQHFKQDSILNELDRKEKELDSLKSVFYSGESSVSYNLKDRYARFLPIPVFKCEFGGKVVVQIVVNQRGVVQKATVVEELSQADDCLWKVAEDAAVRSRFNEKPDAPAAQRGTITYKFVKQ